MNSNPKVVLDVANCILVPQFNNEPEIEGNHMTTKRVIIVAKRRDHTKAVSDISGIGVIEGDGVGAQVER